MTWQTTHNALEKNFTFENFAQAVAFVNHVAHIAETLNHHPDLFVHDYNHVRIRTTTHDQGGITQKDHDLADRIDRLSTDHRT
ncbi:4a-hydroxytetrahydrobiopterin dehydratase [Candidatus Parcubacteria bacterium]|nr:4a-hydroxytetrahydrobiopterin dehydratase [Candidatus Parcubacteria bacterium]